jgi:membrane associated rhomboid family serine protease
MALYDRDYVFQRNGGGAGMNATTWLIIANVAVFVLDIMFSQQGSRSALQAYGHFSTRTLIPELQFWRLITFQFLHADVLHLGFNMLGLWSFGRMVEEQLGRYKYLAFYFVCGIFGGLMFLTLNGLGVLTTGTFGMRAIPGLLVYDPRTPLIGASAGVFGVIMACAYIAPNQIVTMIFPPVSMPLKYMAYAFVAIALVTILFRGNNAGGEAAHLGGALAGAFFIRRSHLLRDFFDVFSDSRKAVKKSRANAKEQSFRAKMQEQAELQREVDTILDKVHASGIESLTEREKATLERATKLLDQRGR